MTATPAVVILSLQRDPATMAGGAQPDRRPSRRVENGLGGVQAHFDTVRAALEKAGHDVAVASSLDAPWPLVVGGAAATKVAGRLHGTLGGWIDRRWHDVALRRVARRQRSRLGDRPVLFYCQDVTSTRVGRKVARPGDRVTSVVHVFADSEADEMAARGACRPGDRFDAQIRRHERETLPLADGLVFVSPMSEASILGARPELRETRRAVVPNFLADDWASSERAPLRADARRLITVGSIDERKNHPYAVAIVDALRSGGHDVRLDIVGDGPGRAALVDLLSAEGLDDHVTLHGTIADIRPRLREADLYLHTSSHEAFGIALIEAMAIGLPVAALPVGGVPSVFDDGVEGVYLPPDDADAAASTIAELLDDVERRGVMANAAVDRVARDFSAAAVIPALVAFMTGPGRKR